ncbi:MAG: uncharacterized protein A8A55_3299 [Amphiamblys sp. WSBS2006]|nr:MAG: uncharacterized protein A8A55_3299 [Amphiamblys sp. WSBS2006]
MRLFFLMGTCLCVVSEGKYGLSYEKAPETKPDDFGSANYILLRQMGVNADPFAGGAQRVNRNPLEMNAAHNLLFLDQMLELGDFSNYRAGSFHTRRSSTDEEPSKDTYRLFDHKNEIR